MEIIAVIVRRQGSALLERQIGVAAEGAALFMARGNGTVEFCGWSLFECSASGAYLGNAVAPQDELVRRLGQMTGPTVLGQTAQALADAIPGVLGGYCGPLGVDMLIGCDGQIVSCSEINLRLTMGFVALALAGRHGMCGRLSMDVRGCRGAVALCPPTPNYQIGIMPR